MKKVFGISFSPREIIVSKSCHLWTFLLMWFPELYENLQTKPFWLGGCWGKGERIWELLTCPVPPPWTQVLSNQQTSYIHFLRMIQDQSSQSLLPTNTTTTELSGSRLREILQKNWHGFWCSCWLLVLTPIMLQELIL